MASLAFIASSLRVTDDNLLFETGLFDPLCLLNVFTTLTLRLHYVPGDHGSHGSPKRSAPCDLVNFCLGTQVLLSIITFRHGLSRYPLQTVGLTPGDTTVRYV